MGVWLGVSVEVALAVGDGLWLRVIVGLGRTGAAVGEGNGAGLGAQAARRTIKKRAQRALFSMSALYQPSRGAFSTLSGWHRSPAF